MQHIFHVQEITENIHIRKTEIETCSDAITLSFYELGSICRNYRECLQRAAIEIVHWSVVTRGVSKSLYKHEFKYIYKPRSRQLGVSCGTGCIRLSAL